MPKPSDAGRVHPHPPGYELAASLDATRGAAVAALVGMTNRLRHSHETPRLAPWSRAGSRAGLGPRQALTPRAPHARRRKLSNGLTGRRWDDPP